MPFLAAAFAFAAAPGLVARTLSGETLLLAAAGSPQVVVAADSACAPCLAGVRAFERAGFTVVWLATDPAAHAALLRLRAHHAGLASRAIADADGQLSRRLQLPDTGGVVVFDAHGHEVVRGPSLEVDDDRTLAAALVVVPVRAVLAGRE